MDDRRTEEPGGAEVARGYQRIARGYQRIAGGYQAIPEDNQRLLDVIGS